MSVHLFTEIFYKSFHSETLFTALYPQPSWKYFDYDS